MEARFDQVARERIAELERTFIELSNLPPGFDLESVALDVYDIGVEAARLAQQIGDPVPAWAVPAEQERKSTARLVIERRRKEFLATGNSMCICAAYLEARSIRDPIPEWVLNYFDQAMSKFWRSFQVYAVARKEN